jgi:hypothetical protein
VAPSQEFFPISFCGSSGRTYILDKLRMTSSHRPYVQYSAHHPSNPAFFLLPFFCGLVTGMSVCSWFKKENQRYLMRKRTFEACMTCQKRT